MSETIKAQSAKFLLENTDSEQLKLAMLQVILSLTAKSDVSLSNRTEEFSAYSRVIFAEPILAKPDGKEYLSALFRDITTYAEWYTSSKELTTQLDGTAFVYLGPLADEYYPATYLVGGIDVSKWQGTVDWSKALAKNVSYVFARISYSYTTPDSEYPINSSELSRLQVTWAGYHFLVPASDINTAVKEADLCLKIMGETSHGTMTIEDKPVVVLDLETRGTLQAKSQELFDYIWKWVDTMQKAGYAIIFYSSKGWLDGNLREQDVEWLMSIAPYWHAQYTTAKVPTLPNYVDKASHQQFSADGNGLGHEYGASGSQAIDLNRFFGTWESFKQMYLGGGDIPTPIPPDPDPEPEPPEPEPPAGDVTYVVAPDVTSLNVRSGPGTSYAVVGSMAAGDETVMNDMGGSSAWLQIKGGDLDGKWAAVDYQNKRYMNRKT